MPKCAVYLYIKLVIAFLVGPFVCKMCVASLCSRKPRQLWSDGVHCHSTGYLGQVRLWLLNRCVVVRHPVTLCRLTQCQYDESVHRMEQLPTGINTVQ